MPPIFITVLACDLFSTSLQNSASVRLRFEATDSDGSNSDDKIDDFLFTFSRIYADMWVTEALTGRRSFDRTSLQFRYRLECDSGWYAYDCLCQPPVPGHSSCNADGTITCSTPYISIDSRTCVECHPPANGMCASNAPASDGYVVCNSGWRGPPACSDRELFQLAIFV